MTRSRSLYIQRLAHRLAKGQSVSTAAAEEIQEAAEWLRAIGVEIPEAQETEEPETLAEAPQSPVPGLVIEYWAAKQAEAVRAGQAISRETLAKPQQRHPPIICRNGKRITNKDRAWMIRWLP
jgi:hypothetical protein